MATEGPLIHDGSQCVAAADYSPTGSGLAGLNGSGQFLAVYISAARTVTINGTAATVSYGWVKADLYRLRCGLHPFSHKRVQFKAPCTFVGWHWIALLRLH